MDLTKICISAKEAKYEVAKLTTEQKNATLLEIAKILVEHTNKIMMENAKDITRATAKGMSVGLIDRLRLDEGRIADLAEGMRQVAGLPDPVGEIIETTELKNGLKLEKCRVPMGVIGIIYESRPNVTTDAFALCFKAGSSVILKGGSDSINSNIAITECIKEGLRKCNVNESTMELIDSTDRATTIEFMHMKDYVDV
ncbi:MAG TPA: aldehyde dehydrogenase family protein, partial [Lachnospiraceae bacterium]|nr:aldehyde dehydrogenase family protein [Lachnospiraceae bacterium]